jgi:hypothetical protein
LPAGASSSGVSIIIDILTRHKLYYPDVSNILIYLIIRARIGLKYQINQQK